MNFLVIGDLIVDVTHFGNCTRLAAESCHVPVFEPERTAVTAGGAGRVLRQLAALCGDAAHAAFLLPGATAHGDEVLASLREAYPNYVGVRSDHRLPTKERFVTSAGLAFRSDPVFPASAYAVLDDPTRALVFDTDILLRSKRPWTVVVSDYAKGCIRSRRFEDLLSRFVAGPGLVVYDWSSSGPVNFDATRPYANRPVFAGRRRTLPGSKLVVKLNLGAAVRFLSGRSQTDAGFLASLCSHADIARVDGDSLERLCDGLLESTQWLVGADYPDAVVVTLGDRGALLYYRADGSCGYAYCPAPVRQLPGNPCGCGDVFTAALAYALGTTPADTSFPEAMHGATVAACTFAGTFAASPDDVVVARSQLAWCLPGVK